MPLAVCKHCEPRQESKTKQTLIDNFDRALTHPDAADIEKLNDVLKD